MAQSERGFTPQAGIILGSLSAAVLLIAGLWVGLADRTPVMCGSVLGGSARDLTTTEIIRCDRALSSAATWTWMLIGAAVLAFVVGLVITVIVKTSERAATA